VVEALVTANANLLARADVSELKNEGICVHTYVYRHAQHSFADMHAQHGETPLHLAAREGHLDIVRGLVSARADIWARDEVSLETPSSTS
jgi:ankyrin repeat protein